MPDVSASCSVGLETWKVSPYPLEETFCDLFFPSFPLFLLVLQDFCVFFASKVKDSKEVAI